MFVGVTKCNECAFMAFGIPLMNIKSDAKAHLRHLADARRRQK